MKRTAMAMLLMLALTGCRLIEQSRHAAANHVAAAVVRGLFMLQSGAPAGPSSRPLDRTVVSLATPSPRAAAAVVVVTAPVIPVPASIAAVEPLPLPQPTNLFLKVCLKPAPAQKTARTVIFLCRTRTAVRLDDNGNASL